MSAKKPIKDLIPRNYGPKNDKQEKEYDPYAGETLNLGLDGIRKEYIQNNIIQVKAPLPAMKAGVSGSGVAMDSACANINYNGSFNYVNRQILSYFIASSSFIGYYAMAVIAQNKIVQMGCSSAAKDAMRNGYKLVQEDGEELSRKEQRQIAKLDKKHKLSQNIIEAETFNNVFGIRHVLFKHTDPNFNYEEPFNVDAFKGGKYAGMAQIDPYWITPELDDTDITDPTSINYYEPTFWLINGKRYHKSHFVILNGDPVADYLKPTYRYGGISKTQQVYERVYAGERTANEIPQLVMTKRMNVRKTDLAKAQANKEKFIEKLNAAAEFRDNYGTQVIGKEEEMSQLETSLADLDKSMWANYHLVAAIFQRPVSKLFGTGHGGLGTGDTDEDYDIAMLETLQSGNLEDVAYGHYERLMMSEFNKEMNLDIVWNPLKVMSDKEQAEVNFIKSQTDKNLYEIGAVGEVDVRTKLSADKMSGYSGVEVVEDFGEEPEIDSEVMDSAENNGYASVKLNGNDADKVCRILEDIGIAGHINPEDMHATLIHSKDKNINGTANPERVFTAKIVGEPKFMGEAPYKALVLELESYDLTDRHEQLKAYGGNHSYDEYKPHLSLKYDATNEDLEKLKRKPIRGWLSFSEESFESAK